MSFLRLHSHAKRARALTRKAFHVGMDQGKPHKTTCKMCKGTAESNYTMAERGAVV